MKEACLGPLPWGWNTGLFGSGPPPLEKLAVCGVVGLERKRYLGNPGPVGCGVGYGACGGLWRPMEWRPLPLLAGGGGVQTELRVS